MLTKVHHSVIDGLSGAEIMAVLFDLEPGGREVDGAMPPPESEPGGLEMLARGIAGLPRYPLRALRSLPSALPNLDETPFGTIPGAGTVARVAERAAWVVRRDGVLEKRSALRQPPVPTVPPPPGLARPTPSDRGRSPSPEGARRPCLRMLVYQ